MIGYGTSVRCRSNEKMVILGFQSAAPRRTLTLGPLHMTSCGAESVIATTGIPQPARHKGLMNPRFTLEQVSCMVILSPGTVFFQVAVTLTPSLAILSASGSSAPVWIRARSRIRAVVRCPGLCALPRFSDPLCASSLFNRR